MTDTKPTPCIGADPLCPCQDGDACHYRDTPKTKGFPLPEPHLPGAAGLVAHEGGLRLEPWVSSEPAYTSAQMHEYADAAVAAETERIAVLVETQDTYGDPVGCWFETLAAKIRASKGTT